MKLQETETDKYQDRVRLWKQLCLTVYRLWQDAFNAPRDEAEENWWAAYEQEKTSIRADQNPGYDAWLESYVAEHGLPDCPENYLIVLYLERWKKQHKPIGRCAQVLKWEKQYFQLLNCQGEWIGKRAACCGDKTRPVAIPIGCNHRLCPLCNWHRSERAQLKTKKLFDRLVHPQFLTLTSPNFQTISIKTIRLYRGRVRRFLAEHKEMFTGGIYAIETTYNRSEKTWHVHAHVLVDASFKLPAKDERVEFAGRNMRAFDCVKLALEFDWSRLWCKDIGRKPRKNAKRKQFELARVEFEWWVRGCKENALLEFRGGEWRPIRGLSASEIRKRTEWNRDNRRVMWIKPVDDRQKAAKEVLKYITKCADFCDRTECVSAFYDATKGARLVQTFGSWYGVNFDADFDTRHPEDWGKLQCACGVNHWERMGTFHRHDVEMDEAGRWHLRRAFDSNSAGTVPRPTIRALDAPAREDGATWQVR